MATSQKVKGLFWRNLQGVFFAGYTLSNPSIDNGAAHYPSPNYVSPFIFIIHTVLLPITLTLGAGIKTLIDLATRKKPLSKQDLDNASGIIDTLDDEALGEIREKTILTSNPSSISSKQLVYTIEELKQQVEQQQNQHLSKKNSKLVREKALGYSQILNDPSAAVSYKLSVQDRATIAAQESAKLREISDCSTALIRNSIKRYIAAPHNNGKKLHQLLANELNQHAKKVATEMVASNDKVKIYAPDDFDERVQNQIYRLKNAGKWWKPGIANNAKANRITVAFENYKKLHNADSMNELKTALDERRIGLLTNLSWNKLSYRHTETYKQVFQSSQQTLRR